MKKEKSLRRLLIGPCLLFFGVVVVSFVAMYAGQSIMMERFIMSSINGKLSSMKMSLESKRADMKEAVDLINDDFGDLYDAIKKDQLAIIIDELDRCAKAFKMQGYLLTDMEGNQVATSYSSLRNQEVQAIVEHVSSNGFVSGCGRFLSDCICDYAADVVRDNDGEPIGVIFFVGYIANDSHELASLKGQMQVDVFIYQDNKCIASSEGNDYVGSEANLEQADSCYVNRSEWTGVFDVKDRNYYGAAIPLIDFRNNTIGMMCIGADRDSMEGVNDMVFNIAAIAIIILVILFYVLYRVMETGFVRPLIRLSEEVSVIASGDLTANIDIPESGSEIVHLARSVDDMQNKIKAVLSPIVTSASSIVNSIGQLTYASVQLSDAANRQAASLEEISSSMEQMGANIEQNTDNSINTNKLASEISQLVGAMGSATNSANAAIHNIADDVVAINELVSQTNILALNASVEAARAGEQGKGFSVVAKEVGRLADQTHATADGINTTANDSISQAEDAARMVSEMVPKIERVTGLIREITAACVEQNAGVAQVNTAIMDLNRVTQQNAAGAEEVAVNARKLEELLNELNNSVSVFKV